MENMNEVHVQLAILLRSMKHGDFLALADEFRRQASDGDAAKLNIKSTESWMNFLYWWAEAVMDNVKLEA